MAVGLQLCLDTLCWCHREQGLCHTRRETRQRRTGARHLSLGIGEKPFVLVEGDESYTPTPPSAFFQLPLIPHAQLAQGQRGGLVSSESQRTYPSLGRVPDDERCAARVPLRPKCWPGQLLPIGEATVELCSRLCDYCHVSVRRQLSAMHLLLPIHNPSFASHAPRCTARRWHDMLWQIAVCASSPEIREPQPWARRRGKKEAGRTFGGICNCYIMRIKALVRPVSQTVDGQSLATYQSRCHQPDSPPESTSTGSAAATAASSSPAPSPLRRVGPSLAR